MKKEKSDKKKSLSNLKNSMKRNKKVEDNYYKRKRIKLNKNFKITKTKEKKNLT